MENKNFVTFSDRASGKETFRILSDGNIVFGPAFTNVSDASMQFWEAVQLPKNGEKYDGK